MIYAWTYEVRAILDFFFSKKELPRSLILDYLHFINKNYFEQLMMLPEYGWIRE